MSKLTIVAESLPTRCEICHQTDLFDPVKNHCSRCSEVYQKQLVCRSSLYMLACLNGAICSMMVLLIFGKGMLSMAVPVGGWFGAILGLLATFVYQRLNKDIHRAVIWVICGAILPLFTIIFSDNWPKAIGPIMQWVVWGSMIGLMAGLVDQWLHRVPRDKKKSAKI